MDDLRTVLFRCVDDAGAAGGRGLGCGAAGDRVRVLSAVSEPAGKGHLPHRDLLGELGVEPRPVTKEH